MKKFFLGLLAAVLMTGAATVSAQSPSEAFGVGAPHLAGTTRADTLCMLLLRQFTLVLSSVC
ncbi:MAG TPA: hypothetical protein VK147_13665 [Candidatus Didemnitutus sp.]|nr:hypothetical protein [Candidatus Didemnitutus sp.]